ncbi:MAG: DUF6266 family protein [Prevotellaceae bacterium]|jgi:hypothetical protein|nr:DUF6266 family protein [Prevotellaceae bacterium]
MSIITPSAFGKANKSAGNVIFYQHRGQEVARMKPAHVFNPDTVPQHRQRSKIAKLVELSHLFSPLYNKGFKYDTLKGSPYNQFVKSNIGAFYDSTSKTALVNYELLITSKGYLQTPHIFSASFSESEMTVYVELTSHIDDNTAYATDDVYVIVIIPYPLLLVYTTAKRSSYNEINILIPQMEEYERPSLYVFAASDVHRQSSNTQQTWPYVF